jgi:hypothetical protein
VTVLAGDGLLFAPVESRRSIARNEYWPAAVARNVTDAVVIPVLHAVHDPVPIRRWTS